MLVSLYLADSVDQGHGAWFHAVLLTNALANPGILILFGGFLLPLILVIRVTAIAIGQNCSHER